MQRNTLDSAWVIHVRAQTLRCEVAPFIADSRDQSAAQHLEQALTDRQPLAARIGPQPLPLLHRCERADDVRCGLPDTRGYLGDRQPGGP